MQRKSIQFLSYLLLLLLAGASYLSGQSATNGAIGGTVYDATGAVIPNAMVEATNDATGQSLKATSSGSGAYRILEVEPGHYTVTISADGYQSYKETGVIVTVGSLNDVSPGLKAGSTGTTVEVTDKQPDLQTETPEIATNITEEQIDNLPINGRRWSNFALLTPGVVSNSDGFGLLSFRGISYLLNNSTIDGMDDNQAYFSESRGRTRAAYAVSQAAVQEFQVNTSNFSAEYGRSAGGVINTVTKSGSNALHGELFFYDRDNEWGATNPYTLIQVPNSSGTYVTEVVKPKDWRKQWGFGMGGPLMRDKLFWFYSYDQQARNFPGLARASDPTDTFAPADVTLPSGVTCTSGKITGPSPSYVPTPGDTYACNEALDLNVNYQAGAAYYAQGLQILNSFLGQVPRTGNQVINFPRLDWQIKDRDRVTVQYNRLRWDSPAGLQTQASNTDGRASFGNDFVKEDFGILRWSHVLNNSMVNELRFQYGRDFEYQTSQAPLPNEVPLSNNSFGRPPDVNIGYEFDANGFDIGTPRNLQRAALPDERRIQGEDVFTWSYRNHIIKAGADVNRVNDFISNLYSENGYYSYDYQYDFIADYLHATEGVGGSNYTPHYYTYAQGVGIKGGELATTDYAGFLTDDWRITPRLTLTIGARYEYEYIPANPFQNSSLVLGVANPFAPSISPTTALTTYRPNDRNNIGPRAGFAYDFSGHGNMILRGGYGIYYGRIINANIIQGYLNNGSTTNGQTYYTNIFSSNGPMFPNLLTPASAASLGATPAASFLDPHLQNPQVHMIDLSLEQNLGWGTSLSISYMNSMGREMTGATDVNANVAGTVPVTFTITNDSVAPTPGYITYPHGGRANPLPNGTQETVQVYTGGARYNTHYYQILEQSSNRNSSYNALAVQLRHRLNNSVQFMSNFTWSHALDYNPYINTGNGSYTQYDPANLRAEYGNSSLDVPERFVFEAIYNPHIHGGFKERALLDGWGISPIFQWQTGLPYTPSVTGEPSQAGFTTINGSGGANRLVTLGRNQFFMPDITLMNMRLSRNFNLDRHGEHFRLELLAEAFNVFNHQNITSVATSAYTVCTSGSSAACSAVGADATATHYPYLVFNQLFGTYNNSNSNITYSERQFQIAARLHF